MVYEYDGELAGASLAAPCTCTHSLNMNQRVITLEVGVLVRAASAEELACGFLAPSKKSCVTFAYLLRTHVCPAAGAHA